MSMKTMTISDNDYVPTEEELLSLKIRAKEVVRLFKGLTIEQAEFLLGMINKTFKKAYGGENGT